MSRVDDVVGSSDALAAAVEAVGRSLVRVEGGRRGTGTAVAWSDDGLLVTAEHGLAEDAETVRVGLPDGREEEATVVGRDSTLDVALLRTATALPRPEWVGLEEAKVGHWVLALGRPGRTVRAGFGILGTLGDELRVPAGGRVDRYVESDVGRRPGFSGGPLVDVRGRVLGMNSSGLLRGRFLTVPTETLRRVTTQLLQHGRVQRGFLGVGVFPVRLPAPLADTVKQGTGALVVAVQPGGPAEQAGLLLGDVLLSLDGAPVDGPHGLVSLLDEGKVGRALPAKLLRAGRLEEAQVTVGVRS